MTGATHHLFYTFALAHRSLALHSFFCHVFHANVTKCDRVGFLLSIAYNDKQPPESFRPGQVIRVEELKKLSGVYSLLNSSGDNLPMGRSIQFLGGFL